MNKINEIFTKVYVVSFEGSSRLKSLPKRLEGLDYEIVLGPNKFDLNREKLISEGYVAAGPPINYKMGIFAVTFTHMEIYKKIIDNNLSNVLILEDDVLMLTKNIDYMVNCYNNLPEDWDLFFIGLYNTNINYTTALPRNYKNLMYEGRSRGYGNFNGHLPLEGSNAYAINNNFLDIVMEKQMNPHTFRGPEYWDLFHKMKYFALIEQVFPQIDLKNYRYDDEDLVGELYKM